MRTFRDREDPDEEYMSFIKRMGFNDDQTAFLLKQRNYFLNAKQNKGFDYDAYEREMWYTMNRSGLFENTRDNATGITDWTPHHTRLYITEI